MMTTQMSATILVVDDLPQNLSLVSGILEPHYTVKLAPSGAKALSILAAHKIDLVLLDIMMPEMDGYEVCRRIKEHPEQRDTPVIFVTTLDEKEGSEDWRSMGAIDFITKPIEPEEFLLKVRSALSG